MIDVSPSRILGDLETLRGQRVLLSPDEAGEISMGRVPDVWWAPASLDSLSTEVVCLPNGHPPGIASLQASATSTRSTTAGI